MDLLIEKGNSSFRFSDLDLRVTAVDDSVPAMSIDSRTVTGRNGFIFAGASFTQKTIKVSGRLVASGIRAFMLKKDKVNGLLLDSEPFYLTKMVPTQEEFYQFELPGERTGDLNILHQRHEPWHYRYKVLLSGDVDWSFIGRSSEGVKYNFSMEFTTVELPFGETEASDVLVQGNSIVYRGTAPFSQLEKPWLVELTASGGQNSFYLEIGRRRFEYQHSAPLASGDVLTISGIETKLNRVNVTNRTNYAYFVLEPSANELIRIATNFRGTIKLVGFMELYK